jgi:AcrR family transcriptional regulator
MPRPSQGIDQALLQSGRELFPQLGCAGLSVRAVAEHAGANLGMFHYHFKTKENFLRTLLQQSYEEMFASLSSELAHEGATLERLRRALTVLARFARENRAMLARVWMDAMTGEPVAQAFFRANAPRHLGLLFALLEEARREGLLRETPTLQALAMTLGSIVLPMLFVAGLIEAGVAQAVPWRVFDAQVMTDEAIAQRIELALAALCPPAAKRRRVGNKEKTA